MNFVMKRALILSGIYWNEPFQRHQQFAYYLNRMGYEVYFLERIMSSKFSVLKFWDVIGRKLQKNAEYSNLKVNNELPKGVVPIDYRFINPEDGIFKIYNTRKINKFIAEYGNKFDVIINYLPINTTRMIIERLNYNFLVYDCVRNFSGWGSYRKDILNEEKALIERSDIVFTDSFFLTDYMKQYNKQTIQFLPIANKRWIEGCQRKKIQRIKHFAYFGSVEKHIDIKILMDLAQKGFVIHIWGIKGVDLEFDHIDHGYESDLKKLSFQITSVADAIILPYRGNMDGVIPAKLLQCLSTYMPIYINEFYDSCYLKDYLYVYTDFQDLISLINSYNDSDEETRRDKIRIFLEDKDEMSQYDRFKKTFEQWPN